MYGGLQSIRGEATEELGESIVKPVGEVICIRKFPNFSDDTLTNQMLPRLCGPWRRARPLRTLRVGVRKRPSTCKQLVGLHPCMHTYIRYT